MVTPEIQVVADPPSVALAAAQRVALSVDSAIERGSFSIVLSGGNTPKMLYALLAAEPFRSSIDWTKVHVFFGDERCVPPDDADDDRSLFEPVPGGADPRYRRGKIRAGGPGA